MVKKVFFFLCFDKGNSLGHPGLERWQQMAMKPLEVVNTTPPWTTLVTATLSCRGLDCNSLSCGSAPVFNNSRGFGDLGFWLFSGP